MKITEGLSSISNQTPRPQTESQQRIGTTQNGRIWTPMGNHRGPVAECGENSLGKLENAKAENPNCIHKSEWQRAEPQQNGATRKANAVSIGVIQGGKMDSYLKAQTAGLTAGEAADKIINLWDSPSERNQLNAYRVLDESGDKCEAIIQEMNVKNPAALLGVAKIGLTVEIKANTNESELLRGNTAATKMMREVLNDTFKQPMQEVFGGGEYAKMKPIVTKDDSGTNMIDERNQQVLDRTVENVVGQTVSMLKSVPQGRGHELMKHLHNAIEEKYPGTGEKHVGTNFILRTLSPYIVAGPKFNREERANATVVTKVIQNMANEIKFGEKEKHMVASNPCLETLAPYRSQIVQQLIPPDETPR